MSKDTEIIKKILLLLPDGFTVLRIKDRSVYLHLRFEDNRTRKADIIKPFEDKKNITVISDVMTNNKSLQIINEIIRHLQAS